jgi:hypothetical protein
MALALLFPTSMTPDPAQQADQARILNEIMARWRHLSSWCFVPSAQASAAAGWQQHLPRGVSAKVFGRTSMKIAQTSAIAAAAGIGLFCASCALAQNIGTQPQNRQQQAAPAPVPAPQAATQAVGGQDKRDQTVPRSETRPSKTWG